MIYSCPTWEFAADTHLMKLQRLQKKVHSTIGKFSRKIPIRDKHISLQIPQYTIIFNQIMQTISPSPSPYNIMRIYMFAILDKAKHDTENIRDLN
jgi:hypothetical protein